MDCIFFLEAETVRIFILFQGFDIKLGKTCQLIEVRFIVSITPKMYIQQEKTVFVTKRE